jgi:hypothetical protein
MLFVSNIIPPPLLLALLDENVELFNKSMILF